MSHTRWNLSLGPGRYSSPHHKYKMALNKINDQGSKSWQCNTCQALHVGAKARAAFDDVAVERAHPVEPCRCCPPRHRPPTRTLNPRLSSQVASANRQPAYFDVGSSINICQAYHFEPTGGASVWQSTLVQHHAPYLDVRIRIVVRLVELEPGTSVNENKLDRGISA